jgi:hypothetical protein
MYLIHNTTSNSLKNILKDGYLKSYSLLKKEDPTAMTNEGDGMYTENNFVFFSCVDKLFNYEINRRIILYFNSKLLFNRTFYVAHHNTPKPDRLEDGKQLYQRKYNRYYEKYNDVLKKLFNYSINLQGVTSFFPDAFLAHQQIALSNKVNLKELVGIEFRDKNDATSEVVQYIKKYYPNVEIKIRTKL